MQAPYTLIRRRPRVKTEGPAHPGDDLTVAMEIDVADRPFCTPYYAHVLRGSRLRWSFPGPWAIVFKGRTPLQDRSLIVRGYGEEPEVRIAQDAAAAHYPYSIVAVGVDDRLGQPTETVFLDLACPEMIID